MSKKLLQVVLAILGLIAVVTGFMGLSGGVATDEFYAVSITNNVEGNIILDSNMRYFSGLWLGVGLILFWILPSVEQHSQIVALRLLSLMIFIGGVGRVISILSFGMPAIPFAVFAVLELLFPLLMLWQNGIARSSASPSG